MRLAACLAAICFLPLPNWAAEPFVAGFDRFAEETADAGRLLLTELSCTACHRGPKSLTPKRGPVLDGAAKRFRRQWMKRYLLDPAATKPGTTMPQVLHQVDAAERGQVVDELISYLASQTAPEPEVISTASNPVAVEFWDKGEPSLGQTLYHQVGCVACHEVDKEFQPEKTLLSDLQKRIEKLDLDPEDIKELGLKIPPPVRSVPHGDLAAKYTRRSLSMFLIAPHQLRPSSRMPNLRLYPTDAAHIAAYLLQRQPADLPASSVDDAELAKRGERHFRNLGCIQCHSITGAKPSQTNFAKPLEAISETSSATCIKALPSDTALPSSIAPHFPVSRTQRVALLAALAQPDPEDLLTFTMKQMNCFACHQRGERGGVGPQRYAFFETVSHVDLGDEGRIPPPLDFVGAKLTRKWLENVFSGKAAVRPHFRARMPSYSAHAKSLADQFKRDDASWDFSTDPLSKSDKAVSATPEWLDAKPTPAHIERGRELMNVGCVQCHPIGGEHLPGIVGVDLADLRQRLEPRWLHAFLLDPARLKSNTRMPTFFPNGQSSNKEVYDGDVDRQISAMWAYLNSSPRKLPDKLEQGKAHNFELTPTDEPIVIRTFMKQAGPHAIAVGFAEKLHYALDAERVVIPHLWKGRFLNAHSTWFNRFVPPAEPLGAVLSLPPYTVVGQGDEPPPLVDHPPPAQGPWQLEFQGYELDKKRVPTLLYRHGDYHFRERLAPADGRMRRRIEVRHSAESSPDTTIWISLATDVLRMESDNKATIKPAGKVELQRGLKGRLGKRKSRVEFMAPLYVRGGAGSVEATYQW